jgi:hypothetical protein
MCSWRYLETGRMIEYKMKAEAALAEGRKDGFTASHEASITTCRVSQV